MRERETETITEQFHHSTIFLSQRTKCGGNTACVSLNLVILCFSIPPLLVCCDLAHLPNIRAFSLSSALVIAADGALHDRCAFEAVAARARESVCGRRGSGMHAWSLSLYSISRSDLDLREDARCITAQPCNSKSQCNSFVSFTTDIRVSAKYNFLSSVC